ncbi:MAG: IclR family transcriptional regulator, partial [Hylemonella sp.]
MPRSSPLAAPAASGSSSERSLRLLARLAEEGRPLSLAELASYLALPKATAHRLCAQLLETGFIVRGVGEREFAVGPALRKLALDTLNHDSVRGLRHELLADLVAQVGETCNLTTLDGAAVLYLDRVEAPWPWRLTLAVGEHVPLHCTASGKLFLALMPPAQREALLAQLKLPRMTDSTITSARALREECLKIASAGYALDREEFITGLVAIAVPVLDQQDQVRAALAIHAPRSRLSLEQAQSRLPALRAAAKRMR